MNRDDLKEYFRTIVQSTTEEQNKRSMLNESSDWQAKSDAEFNIDAQFLAAVISRGMDVLRGIWMEGEETDRVYRMIDNNAPVTDIIAYLRELEAAGKTYKDVEHKYDDLPPDEDTVDDDLDDDGKVPYSKEYAKMIDTFSPYPK
tara:strand:+ start:552 stop:986 length:435 start_codon:yes stop_codon:yes gene_type:complete